MRSIAYFISPHGFGHAARAAAVISELLATYPLLKVHVFSTVPEWFFRDSLPEGTDIYVHSTITDVGFVQLTPTEEDLRETVRRLDKLYPLSEQLISDCCNQVDACEAELVVCDIAVLGLVVAKRLGLPSVLIENFTWDWLYEGYLSEEPELLRHIEYLRPLFALASKRIQTSPVCISLSSALTVPPVARKVRRARADIRYEFGIADHQTVVLLSMGGTKPSFDFLSLFAEAPEVIFLVAGVEQFIDAAKNVIFFPPKMPFFHPDLVGASDAIVGKVGYSTVAESYFGRTQFFFVPRPRFRESKVMEEFVTRELNGVAITEADFSSGSWIKELSRDLKAVDRTKVLTENGAARIAKEISALLGS